MGEGIFPSPLLSRKGIYKEQQPSLLGDLLIARHLFFPSPCSSSVSCWMILHIVATGAGIDQSQDHVAIKERGGPLRAIERPPSLSDLVARRPFPRRSRSDPLLSPRGPPLTCVRRHGDGRGEVFPGLEVSSVLHRAVPAGSEAAGVVAVAPLGQEVRRGRELPAIHTGAALQPPKPRRGRGPGAGWACKRRGSPSGEGSRQAPGVGQEGLLSARG